MANKNNGMKDVAKIFHKAAKGFGIAYLLGLYGIKHREDKYGTSESYQDEVNERIRQRYQSVDFDVESQIDMVKKEYAVTVKELDKNAGVGKVYRQTESKECAVSIKELECKVGYGKIYRQTERNEE